MQSALNLIKIRKSDNQSYDFYYANEGRQFECLINLFYFEKPIKFSILF